MLAPSVEALMQSLIEHARAVIGTHQAVASLSIGADLSQTIVALSLSDKYAKYRAYDERPQGIGIYTLVCRDNRPMRMTQAEMESHPAWQNFGTQKSKHPPLRGWLAAPLLGLDGRNLGLVQLSDKYEGEFTPQDEATLVQLAKMAAAATENVRLLDDIRRATHDLNNLLTVVAGFSELLAIQAKPSEAAGAFAKEIKSAADRAAALVADLRKSCGIKTGEAPQS